MKTAIRFLTILIGLLLVACSGGLPGDPHASICIEDGFTLDQQQDIITATEEWRDRTNWEISPSVRTGTGCDLQVQPTGVLVELGKSMVDRIEEDGSAIYLATQATDEYNELVPHWFYTFALHELGHYWTGPGHLTSAADIMYGRQQPEVWHLTDRDIRRFYKR